MPPLIPPRKIPVQLKIIIFTMYLKSQMDDTHTYLGEIPFNEATAKITCSTLISSLEVHFQTSNGL